MKNTPFNVRLTGLLMLAIVWPQFSYSQSGTKPADIYSGYYSQDSNTQSLTRATSNDIYIKLFADQWIATLYLPYPYSTTVEPAAIDKVLDQAKKQTFGSAYIRGNFGQLSQLATAHIERFGYLQDRLVFECGSLAPCTIKMGEGYLELIKPGIINEHIIRYNHVVGQ